MDEEGVAGQKISLRCCISLRRISQPVRGRACDHPAAFCSSGIACLRQPTGGKLRCPLCGKFFDEAELKVDVRLTLFLAQHPKAYHAHVRRKSDGTWSYRSRKPAAQPAHPFAAPKLPTAGASSSSHPPPHEDRGMKRTVDRRGTSFLLPRSVALARAPSEAEVPPTVRGSARASGAAALPAKLPAGEKAARRAARTLNERRQIFLAAAKAELVKRALWEDPLPGREDAWSVG